MKEDSTYHRFDRRQFVVAATAQAAGATFAATVATGDDAAEAERTPASKSRSKKPGKAEGRAPGFAKASMKQRAIAEVGRTYSGTILFPDELTTVDLST